MTPEQRDRVQRMEQIGLMAAGASHDFNNTAQCMLGEMATVEARLRELGRLMDRVIAPDATRVAQLIAECQRSLEIVDTGLQAAVASNREVQRMYRGDQ